MKYRLVSVAALVAIGGTQAQCPPQINDAATQLMQGYETYQPNPYDDGYGNITVGYGHKCADSSCSDVTDQGYSFPMSQSDADSLFQSDLQVRSTERSHGHRTDILCQISNTKAALPTPSRPRSMTTSMARWSHGPSTLAAATWSRRHSCRVSTMARTLTRSLTRSCHAGTRLTARHRPVLPGGARQKIVCLTQIAIRLHSRAR